MRSKSKSQYTGSSVNSNLLAKSASKKANLNLTNINLQNQSNGSGGYSSSSKKKSYHENREAKVTPIKSFDNPNLTTQTDEKRIMRNKS